MNPKIRIIQFSALIVALALCANTFNFDSSTVTAQQPGQTIALSGLRDRVTVRRDERGIPYIEAANDDDLYFAQGYIMASDRLCQMDLMRRTAHGELAEVL